MRLRTVFLMLVVFVAVAFFAACEKAPMGNEETKEIKAEAVSSSPASVLTIAFNSNGKSVPFSVEVAQSDTERAQGLKNRESLPKNGGMWFVFPQMGQEMFWMKDTKIPLDLIFVDDGMKVVHIIENAVPESSDHLESPKPYQYVLETNAGAVKTNGIKVGDAVAKSLGAE